MELIVDNFPRLPHKALQYWVKGQFYSSILQTLYMKAEKHHARKKSQRPAQVYNTLPTKVTRKEFNRHILPHLTQSKRQKPRISYFKIFNHILYVLHTGIQWENLPVRDAHWSSVYRHHNRWSKDGSYKKIFDGSLDFLAEEGKLNPATLHGDGSNVVAKKGARESATRGTNTNEAKKPLISKTIPVIALSPASRRA